MVCFSMDFPRSLGFKLTRFTITARILWMAAAKIGSLIVNANALASPLAAGVRHIRASTLVGVPDWIQNYFNSSCKIFGKCFKQIYEIAWSFCKILPQRN